MYKIIRKINFPLWIGVLLLTLLLFMSLFPQKFTQQDPTFRNPIRFEKVIENGEAVHKIVAPPWGPTKENIMGTDEFGRDIYARLVHGTKITLRTAILVVIFRLLIALPLGIIAGIGSKTISSLIKFWNTVFTAIPALFAAFIIFNIQYLSGLQVESSIKAFAVVLTILGWGKLAKQVEETSHKIMMEEFIEGEVAVGKNKFQIALQNMIPHLIPSLISIAFIEVGMVIFFLAQLSILDVYVGPRSFIQRIDDSYLAVAINPEWASMLSRTVLQNRLGNYWVSLYPALAFTVGILAFNLTGEGLRVEFEKRTSRVTSMIRRFGFIFSPKIYFQQILRFKEYYRPVIMKTLCILIVVTYLAIPAPKSLYEFDVTMAMEHIEELMSPEYEGRLAGFEGGYLAGEYIVSKLMEYGLEPYEDENYYQVFDLYRATPPGRNIQYGVVEDGFINLISEDGETITYYLNKDFIIAAFNGREMMDGDLKNNYLSFTGFSSTDEKSQQIMKEKDIDDYIRVEVSDGTNLYPNLIYPQINNRLQFIILDEDRIPVIPTFLSTQYTILPWGELAERLQEDHYEVEVNMKMPKMPDKGRNIFAVLPGEDWDKPNDSNNKKELIIIGSSYDGLGMIENRTSAASASKPAINLEIARILSSIDEPFNKTIIFAFWDGNTTWNPGTYFYNMFGRLYTQQYYKIYYFDVGQATKDNAISIEIQSPVTAQGAQVETYELIKGIENRLKKTGVDFVFRGSNSSTFHEIGLNMSLKISVDTPNYGLINSVEDTIENLNENQMKNIGQFYIDLITMDDNFK
ncbi:ABC transporter permease subunit [Alkaliphilus transvaalensis]|uniref:ABC transporter permease subunit n=1 Tax=Alkaliphilus transvaalensis TaxID=114628 RepID=UPI00047A0557|nr:ABC transporter permease subunit [Alkaliphilus transvaalensis]